MRNWIKSLIGDGKNNPSEAIVFALFADFVLLIVIFVLIVVHHYPTIPEVAGGFSAIHAICHGGTWANNG